MSKTILVILFLATINGYAQDRLIVVNDCETMGAIDKQNAAIVTDQIRVKLSQTFPYKVVERTKLDAVIKEQNLQLSDLVNPESAAKAGQLIGAKEVLIPTLSKIGKSYILNIRSVDVESGIITKAVGGSCQHCEVENVVMDLLNTVVADLAEKPVEFKPFIPLSDEDKLGFEEPVIKGYGPLRSGIARLIKELDLYPVLALQAGIEGKVLIRLDITKTGRIKEYKTIKSSADIFNSVAEKLVRGIEIEPARKNGTPVDTWFVVPISFRIRGAEEKK